MIFVLDGLNALKWIKIEKNSFTKVDDTMWKDPNIMTADLNDPKKSFHIMNCELLQAIVIGEFCFSDFQGEFELLNLPSLQTLQIGSLENDSLNFRYASCVVRSIASVLQVRARSSPTQDTYIWNRNIS